MTMPKYAQSMLALLAALHLSTGCSPALDAPDSDDTRRSESLHQTPVRIDDSPDATTCRDAGATLGVSRSERWVACRLDLSRLSSGLYIFTQASDFLANGEVCAGLLNISLQIYQSTEGPALIWESLNTRTIDGLFIRGSGAGNLYTYRPSVQTDEGVHAPRQGASWADVEDVSFCVERALTTQFSLLPGAVGPYDWHLEKSATPQRLELGPEASGNVTYEVTVSATDIGPREIFVEGIAYLTNTTDADAHIQSASVEIDGRTVALDCGVNFPSVLKSQSGLECTYRLSGFDESVNESTIAALLNVDVSDESPTRGARATQSILLSLPPLDALERVIVRDGDDIRAPCPFDQQPCVFNYTRTFECPFDEGIDEREAHITAPLQTASAPVEVDCAETHQEGQLLVQTFAEGSFHGPYLWHIEKNAAPEAIALGTYESGEVDYTLNVYAEETGESYYVVEGSLRILNLTDVDADVAHVSVKVGEREALVDCNAAFPIAITAAANLICTFTAVDIDPSITVAVARVEATPTSAVGGVVGQSDISYDDRPPSPLESVQVRALVDGVEIFDEACHWQDRCLFEYSRTFSCPLDEGVHLDSAYLPATGQRAEARVDVTCTDATVEGELRIQSAPLTGYTRSYTWAIDGSASHERVPLAPGHSAEVTYHVEVTGQDVVDHDHIAHGPVFITNPHASDALIETVTTRAGDTPGNVDCGVSFPYVLQAGQGLECTQMISGLSGDEPRSELIVRVSATSTILGGVSRWNLDWGLPTTHLFRDVTVRAEVEGVQKLEQTCSWDSGCTFEYSTTFSYPDDAGQQRSTVEVLELELQKDLLVDVVCQETSKHP
ncbi:hypothetical protein DV096_12085 [Bradymonadaceae bacterium TMQ3]|nr:hypothetical protein DV096_12085 [Bradymonadaceae bacterium TMQ3]TXC75372.1 hypothetical protein FRC91_11680 [Bradymonadales bacterium TMQ1]